MRSLLLTLHQESHSRPITFWIWAITFWIADAPCPFDKLQLNFRDFVEVVK